MKIKTRSMPYDKIVKIKPEKHRNPKKPSLFFRKLLKTLSSTELRDVNFSFESEGMERLGKKEPALFLMNHSSFIDLKIASTILYPRPFNIICTSDGFIGKNGLMRSLGCIPTKKFITDTTLVRDMVYAVKKSGSSILMYPEASYSFDGTATPLPSSIGKLLKLLDVPVVMINMEGKGTKLRCLSCGKTWELSEDGYHKAEDGTDIFDHVPDWYAWERECVRRELESGSYQLDIPVTIRMMVDTKCIYTAGEGRLVHTADGFRLTGCEGKLDYTQKPSSSYSLYSDYYWYELGDMICIGTPKVLYYCFPKDSGDVVAKTRLAAEEIE